MGVWKTGARLFSSGVQRMEGQQVQKEIQEIPLNIKKKPTQLFYGESNQGLQEVVHVLGDAQNPTGNSPRKLALSESALSRWLVLQ